MDPNPDKKPEAAEEVRQLTSLDEIEAVCRQPANTEIRVRGKAYMFPLRLLSPIENERLNRILSEATPPVIEQEDPQTGKPVKAHDLANPKYLVQANRLRRVSRAFALVWCCPLFSKALAEAKGKPFETLDPDTGEAKTFGELDPKNRDHLEAFVTSKLTEEILEELYAAARGEEEREDEQVGFLSKPY